MFNRQHGEYYSILEFFNTKHLFKQHQILLIIFCSFSFFFHTEIFVTLYLFFYEPNRCNNKKKQHKKLPVFFTLFIETRVSFISLYCQFQFFFYFLLLLFFVIKLLMKNVNTIFCVLFFLRLEHLLLKLVITH